MILSIIIPIYNVEKYIKDCVESVLNQRKNADEVEVILVNDGTPDNSMSIVETAVKDLKGIYIINKENGGLSSARNAGLMMARGDYIWFVDSDDTLLPNAIEEVFEVLSNHLGFDVFATVLLTKKENSSKKLIEYSPNEKVYTGKEYMFSGNRCGATQRFILRRQFLLDNNLFFMEGVCHEDGEFGYKMLYLAESVYVLRKPVYCYLLRDGGSIMSSRKMKMNYDLIKIYNELEVFCENRVLEKDKWKYRAEIFDCLKCTILFSSRMIYSKEFKSFYEEYRKMNHMKAGELFFHPIEIGWKKYVECLHFFFIPLFYTKFKTRVRYCKNKIF